MIEKSHGYRVGPHEEWYDSIPSEEEKLDAFIQKARKQIEPWLSSVFQSEHLNLLLGSGFTTAIGNIAKAKATKMDVVDFGTSYDEKIVAHAKMTAITAGRGEANIEDQIRSALALIEGLKVQGSSDAEIIQKALNVTLHNFLLSLLQTERGIAIDSKPEDRDLADLHLQSFLMSFASRVASRERLHIFTTNYDRLIEHGCDLVGLRIIDRFVGALNLVFRSQRIEVDVHYNPPGIRGEPRFLEGVVRFTKLHGSLDWLFDRENRLLRRKGIPFGAPANHTDIPSDPVDTVMIYPNPAKDVETTEFPYAELFRDFASALCRPNSVLVTYGYGFGDDHINRVIEDMLTIPSTHLVVFGFSPDERLTRFEKKGRTAQISLIIGEHFADIKMLVENYLPKPAIDHISSRMARLLKERGEFSADDSKDGNGAKAEKTASSEEVPF